MSDVMHPMSPAKRTLVTVVVMAGMLMVVLDTTIANVALPHMQAALSANAETIAWVLTAYIVATAIAMPVTGWLSDRYGRRALFTVAVAGFTVSSALCGVSTSLGMMVGARVLQGVFGAFLAPLSQAVMYDIYPPSQHARAMTIWGLGIMVGPVTGPVLGGWLTDAYDWRWVFFINLPIGVLTTAGAWALLQPTEAVRRRFDITGFALLALMLASFQLCLDRGTQLDWFESWEIRIEAATCLAALWMFAVHSATARDPLVPVSLFRNGNFVVALAFITVTGGILTAGAALIAPMLQRLLGYPVYDAGLLVAPRGIGVMVAMLIAGRMAGKVDGRFMVFGGMLLLAWSLWLQTRFDLQMDARPIIVSGVIQGFGIGLTVLPLNLLAFATLAPALRTEAAALYSLLRNLGASVAISVASALVASNTQQSHSDLVTNVTTITLPFLQRGSERLGIDTSLLMVMLDAEVNRQALMIAYLDDFWLMMWASLLVAPLAFVMRRGGGAAPAVHLE